ncbi:hypothetical protein CRX72_17960 [Pantoea sp. BRM17]|nr:hypothetical protein CRX72_17960 [Pantoea sp. BRM17]
MTSAEAVDVRQLINRHALSRWQKRLIALCFVIVALDGMDIALMGFIACKMNLTKVFSSTAFFNPLFLQPCFDWLRGGFSKTIFYQRVKLFCFRVKQVRCKKNVQCRVNDGLS